MSDLWFARGPINNLLWFLLDLPYLAVNWNTLLCKSFIFVHLHVLHLLYQSKKKFLNYPFSSIYVSVRSSVYHLDNLGYRTHNMKNTSHEPYNRSESIYVFIYICECEHSKGIQDWNVREKRTGKFGGKSLSLWDWFVWRWLNWTMSLTLYTSPWPKILRRLFLAVGLVWWGQSCGNSCGKLETTFLMYDCALCAVLELRM